MRICPALFIAGYTKQAIVASVGHFALMCNQATKQALVQRQMAHLTDRVSDCLSPCLLKMGPRNSGKSELPSFLLLTNGCTISTFTFRLLKV